MENRRAHYRLLLTNLAAAYYNLAAQSVTPIIISEPSGLWRLLIALYLPSLFALIASILLLSRKPRGVKPSLLKSGVAVQVLIWIIISVSRGHNSYTVLTVGGLLLALIYALISWSIMIQSRESILREINPEIRPQIR